MAKRNDYQEAAHDIVGMLRAALMVMPNDREGHPLNSYQQNRMSPGMNYAIDLITRAFNLDKEKQ